MGVKIRSRQLPQSLSILIFQHVFRPVPSFPSAVLLSQRRFASSNTSSKQQPTGDDNQQQTVNSQDLFDRILPPQYLSFTGLDHHSKVKSVFEKALNIPSPLLEVRLASLPFWISLYILKATLLIPEESSNIKGVPFLIGGCYSGFKGRAFGTLSLPIDGQIFTHPERVRGLILNGKVDESDFGKAFKLPVRFTLPAPTEIPIEGLEDSFIQLGEGKGAMDLTVQERIVFPLHRSVYLAYSTKSTLPIGLMEAPSPLVSPSNQQQTVKDVLIPTKQDGILVWPRHSFSFHNFSEFTLTNPSIQQFKKELIDPIIYMGVNSSTRVPPKLASAGAQGLTDWMDSSIHSMKPEVMVDEVLLAEGEKASDLQYVVDGVHRRLHSSFPFPKLAAPFEKERQEHLEEIAKLEELMKLERQLAYEEMVRQRNQEQIYLKRLKLEEQHARRQARAKFSKDAKADRNEKKAEQQWQRHKRKVDEQERLNDLLRKARRQLEMDMGPGQINLSAIGSNNKIKIYDVDRHYEMLGFTDLRHLPSDDDIQAAWRQQLKDHHPDLGGSTDRAAKINAARSILATVEGRRDYQRKGFR